MNMHFYHLWPCLPQKKKTNKPVDLLIQFRKKMNNLVAYPVSELHLIFISLLCFCLPSTSTLHRSKE